MQLVAIKGNPFSTVGTDLPLLSIISFRKWVAVRVDVAVDGTPIRLKEKKNARAAREVSKVCTFLETG